MLVMTAEHRVILAIGDQDLRHSLIRSLRLEPDRVSQVDSTGDLFYSLHRAPTDIVVLDLSLCDSDGVSTLRAIRASSPSTLLIACTTESKRTDAAVVEEGVFFYAAGMDAAQLAEAVRAGLRLKGGRR